jgi:uncharacterized protein DUF4242
LGGARLAPPDGGVNEQAPTKVITVRHPCNTGLRKPDIPPSARCAWSLWRGVCDCAPRRGVMPRSRARERVRRSLSHSAAASIPAMPKYMIVRSFDCGEADMPAVGSRSRQLIEDTYKDVIWQHSHVVVDDDGKVRTYCVYDAPDEETVRAHSRDLGRHGIDSIDEIAGDVTPADFPAV